MQKIENYSAINKRSHGNWIILENINGKYHFCNVILYLLDFFTQFLFRFASYQLFHFYPGEGTDLERWYRDIRPWKHPFTPLT